MTAQGAHSNQSAQVEQNKAVVREAFEAVWQGDLAKLEQHPGLADMRQLAPRVLAAFPDFSGHVVRQIAEGDTVATYAEYEATQQGPFMGIAPTGRKVSFQGVSVDRLQDGKIVERHSELGWLSVMLQLGVLPLGSK